MNPRYEAPRVMISMHQPSAKTKAWKLDSLAPALVCGYIESLARMADPEKPYTIYLTVRSKAGQQP